MISGGSWIVDTNGSLLSPFAFVEAFVEASVVVEEGFVVLVERLWRERVRFLLYIC
jgi:hypothetical protein